MIPSYSFRPKFYLRNAQLQTMLASLKLRARGQNAMLLAGREIILDTPAGVRLQGFYSRQRSQTSKGLVIFLHGWEGSVDSTYILCCGRTLYHNGYDVFRLNFRDHGTSHRLNEGLFYAVLIDEIFQAVNMAAAFAGGLPVFLVGFSLGGNFVLRILKLAIQTPILGLHHAVAVSPAIDPEKSTNSADRHPMIRRYFLNKWFNSLEKKQRLFPDIYDFEDILQLGTIRRATEVLLQQYSNFKSAEEYFNAYSVKGNDIEFITVPTTILTAEDDPIIPINEFYGLSLNADTHLSVQAFGGHNAFISDLGLRGWYENLIVSICNETAENQKIN